MTDARGPDYFAERLRDVLADVVAEAPHAVAAWCFKGGRDQMERWNLAIDRAKSALLESER